MAPSRHFRQLELNEMIYGFWWSGMKICEQYFITHKFIFKLIVEIKFEWKLQNDCKLQHMRKTMAASISQSQFVWLLKSPQPELCIER